MTNGRARRRRLMTSLLAIAGSVAGSAASSIARTPALVAAAADAEAGAAAQRDATPAMAALRLGVLPYLSTRQLLGFFEPLRLHISTAIAAPVELLAAPDLRAYARNLQTHQYDIALVAPHFALLASRDWGYQVVAMSTAKGKAVILKRRGTTLVLPAGLRGRKLATLDRLSLTTLNLLEWLRANNLEPGRDLALRYVPNLSSQLAAIDEADVAALVVADSLLGELPEERRNALEVALEIATLPPPVVVMDATLPPARQAAVRDAVLSFAGTGPGKGTLSRSPFEPATLRDLATAERFARQLESELAAGG